MTTRPAPVRGWNFPGSALSPCRCRAPGGDDRLKSAVLAFELSHGAWSHRPSCPVLVPPAMPGRLEISRWRQTCSRSEYLGRAACRLLRSSVACSAGPSRHRRVVRLAPRCGLGLAQRVWIRSVGSGPLVGRLAPRRLEVAWAKVMAAVRDYGKRLLDDPGRVLASPRSASTRRRA